VCEIRLVDDAGCEVAQGEIGEITAREPVSPMQYVNAPVPDADLGQKICACITLRDGARKFSLVELTDFLRDKGLEVNKLPEYLRFYRSLPLTPAGKIDKRALADEAAKVGDIERQAA